MKGGVPLPHDNPDESARAEITLRVTLAVWVLMWTNGVQAAPAPDEPRTSQPLPEVLVIGSTPLPGASIDIDKVPGNVQILSSADLTRQGSASLVTALNSNLGSVNINDNFDDPFQPDILYRGFEASPVLGTPQGLAVYENGVRINEAFGDTVNWDLFPDAAVNRVELVSASPLYGRNALGGAITVTMKNGFTYRGTDLEFSGGSYGNRAVVAEFGASSGVFGVYVAGRALDWSGWRQFSSNKLRSLYAAVSMHSDHAVLDLSFTRADNTLENKGAAPVQELAVNRSLVFTGPQSDLNTLNFLTLNGTFTLTGSWSLQGVAYYRDYSQNVPNGNTTNYVACASPAGILCQPDGVTPLMNAAGQTLPDISEGGTIPIGENDFESIHAWGRGITGQISDSEPLWGHDNQFSVGVAVDYASTSFYTGAQIGIINPQLVVLPSSLIVYTPENSPAAIANGDPVPVSVDSVNRSLGGYVTDTYNITPALALTASGRYNISHIDLADQLGTNLSGTNRFVHFNPAVGATYKILPTATLYGGISTNTRTPTASEIECSNPSTPCVLPTSLAGDPPNLRQVIAHAAELGLRGKATAAPDGGELSWNLSLFRTLLHDDIYGISTSVAQGFFQNIGDTRRQGIELGLNYRAERWSGFLNYSFVQATFESALLTPSPSNPYRDAKGNIQIEPGDRLPGIPNHRVKLGIDCEVTNGWEVGTTVNYVSSVYYAGDQSNQLAPLPGYTVVNLHSTYRPLPHLELFTSINNLFNRKYATSGILSDPTGIGTPGVPPNGVTNGPGVDNRFQSPAAPFEAFAGVRLKL